MSATTVLAFAAVLAVALAGDAGWYYSAKGKSCDAACATNAAPACNAASQNLVWNSWQIDWVHNNLAAGQVAPSCLSYLTSNKAHAPGFTTTGVCIYQNSTIQNSDCSTLFTGNRMCCCGGASGCEIPSPPTDCVVGSWAPYDACSAECGGGVQTKTREIVTPAQYGGKACPVLSVTKECNVQDCPFCGVRLVASSDNGVAGLTFDGIVAAHDAIFGLIYFKTKSTVESFRTHCFAECRSAEGCTAVLLAHNAAAGTAKCYGFTAVSNTDQVPAEAITEIWKVGMDC